jgi:hypothetical protein
MVSCQEICAGRPDWTGEVKRKQHEGLTNLLTWKSIRFLIFPILFLCFLSQKSVLSLPEVCSFSDRNVFFALRSVSMSRIVARYS